MTIPLPRSRAPNNTVAALIYEGLCSFEFACAAEVFGLSRPEFTGDWYEFITVGLHNGKGKSREPIKGQYGHFIVADHGLRVLRDAATIIIPGWQSVDTPVPQSLVKALQGAYDNGARILTICSGVFVLAATGLLNGKRAATHWRYAQALRERYPDITVDADVLYIDEGQLLTSAGSAAGIDLSLHLVRRDYSAEIANNVARRLVVPPHRDGGQAQFIHQPVAARERDALAPLLDRMRKRLAEPISIAALAEQAAMSERTFMRRFKEATGTTPIDWLITVRVDKARELLEGSQHSIDRIAELTGFGTAITMRHHFRKKIQVSPSEYRARFSRVAQRGSELGAS